MRIEFFVPGIPKPGGSKIAQPVRRKGGKIVMYKDKCGNDVPLITVRDACNNKEWRANVAHEARLAMQDKELFSGPVRLYVAYLMPRPKSHYGKKGLKPSAPRFHTSEPDPDKLMRATQDAMKGITWRDDGQIAVLIAVKEYDKGQGCGAKIVISDEPEVI